VGETRIAMADGTSRPVAEIAEGDLVLGDDGRVNRVLGIDRLTLDDRLLFGFNGSQPFVTASHPFMTEDGWKAIDPTHSYTDHRVPAVGRLEIGTRLLLLTGVRIQAAIGGPTLTETSLDIQTESHPLVSVERVSAPASTALLNLRLDGNHTYFANDLLVHNKIFQVMLPGDGGVPTVGGF
jgi:hypothetical protein